jgi:hypothetical protein
LGLVPTENGKDGNRRVGLAYFNYDGWLESDLGEDVTVGV